VVSDNQGIRTDLSNPVGLVLAPVTVAANIGTGTAGGALGAVGIVDNSPAEPGRRVALGERGQARLAQLQAAPNGRAFDRTYIDQQARSDARTLALYDAYGLAAADGGAVAGAVVLGVVAAALFALGVARFCRRDFSL